MIPVQDAVALQNLAVGRTITLFRTAKRLNTSELSDISMIDHMRLKRIEKGSISVTIEELASLAAVFDISNSEFVTIADGIRERWRYVGAEGGTSA